MEEEKKIRIRWHVDRTKDPAVYMLICEDPEHQDLQVSVSSAEMTERVAKAKLMQAMFELGKERGIDFRVFSDETRPLLQGARLTSYELQRAGVDIAGNGNAKIVLFDVALKTTILIKK